MEKDELNFLEGCKKLINEGKKPDELKKIYSKDLIKKSGLLSPVCPCTNLQHY